MLLGTFYSAETASSMLIGAFLTCWESLCTILHEIAVTKAKVQVDVAVHHL